jgi:hypothetical protein
LANSTSYCFFTGKSSFRSQLIHKCQWIWIKQKSSTKQITLLTSLIKKSESFVALTRAGISASIGLTDYASKTAKNVVVENGLAEDNLKGKCLAMNAE